jgi:hypothetical protein
LDIICDLVTKESKSTQMASLFSRKAAKTPRKAQKEAQTSGFKP